MHTSTVYTQGRSVPVKLIQFCIPLPQQLTACIINYTVDPQGQVDWNALGDTLTARILEEVSITQTHVHVYVCVCRCQMQTLSTEMEQEV